jgi:hypothetical protein
MKIQYDIEGIGKQALKEALKIINGAKGNELMMAENRISRAIEILGGSRSELFSNALRTQSIQEAAQ